MNRKNTILLAVLINAGLLLVLFISALTSQEEIAIAPTHEISSHSSLHEQDLALPLFGDEIDFAVHSPLSAKSHENLPEVVIESSLTKGVEPSVVHSLPPFAQEAPVAAPVAATQPVVVQAPVETRSSENFLEVAVKKGDTLEKIARTYKTTVDELIRLNRLPSSFLRIGQVLKLPGEKSIAAKAPTKATLPERIDRSGPEYYTVKVGDNPWSIAMKNRLKVEELLRLNNLNEEKARRLKPGDRLRIR